MLAAVRLKLRLYQCKRALAGRGDPAVQLSTYMRMLRDSKSPVPGVATVLCLSTHDQFLVFCDCSNGANVDMQDEQGNTPGHIAALYKHLPLLVKLLVSNDYPTFSSLHAEINLKISTDQDHTYLPNW